jgi:hypothetical protein
MPQPKASPEVTAGQVEQRGAGHAVAEGGGDVAVGLHRIARQPHLQVGGGAEAVLQDRAMLQVRTSVRLKVEYGSVKRAPKAEIA